MVLLQYHDPRMSATHYNVLTVACASHITEPNGIQDVEKFVREKDELERDRLRMHAENDALQNKLEETEREQEHRYIQGTMTLKKEYDQKMEEARKRYVRKHCSQSFFW